MVKLYEYQGKQLLKKQGVSIPEGAVASTPEEVEWIADKIGMPVAIKAQVWSTGRGKVGARAPLRNMVWAQSHMMGKRSMWLVIVEPKN